jgi:hypothetical protein
MRIVPNDKFAFIQVFVRPAEKGDWEMDTQNLKPNEQEPRRRYQRSWKPRSMRCKYRILEILAESGTSTLDEITELLKQPAVSVSKTLHGLKVSGLVKNIEENGQKYAITGNGVRVLIVAHRERNNWLERRGINSLTHDSGN